MERDKIPKGKEGKKMKLRNIIITALIVILALVLMIGNVVGAFQEYNNGVCECGGHFHLVDTPNRTHVVYTYECDVCGYTIVSFMRLK